METTALTPKTDATISVVSLDDEVESSYGSESVGVKGKMSSDDGAGLWKAAAQDGSCAKAHCC